MKKIVLTPSYWICGAGGNVNCEEWDDINGCWKGCKNVMECPIFARLEEDRDDLLEPGEE